MGEAMGGGEGEGRDRRKGGGSEIYSIQKCLVIYPSVPMYFATSLKAPCTRQTHAYELSLRRTHSQKITLTLNPRGLLRRCLDLGVRSLSEFCSCKAISCRCISLMLQLIVVCNREWISLLLGPEGKVSCCCLFLQ